ncbi:MAG: hypothetical protein LBL80_02725 [Ruminococcus sp.]|jgi:hypothetical protein|nr:hypothetical protein [Ruminococcus sp.]
MDHTISILEPMAKIIHANYNNKRETDGLPVEYPTWNGLPDSLKNSNLSRARGVFAKLSRFGYTVSDKPLHDSEEVFDFTPEQLEMLTREVHGEWVAERIQNGFTCGERDAEKKTTPYLVPFEKLTEEIKDYDRDVVRNIFPMLKKLGLMVYKIS